jgi:hypothetical protein
VGTGVGIQGKEKVKEKDSWETERLQRDSTTVDINMTANNSDDDNSRNNKNDSSAGDNKIDKDMDRLLIRDTDDMDLLSPTVASAYAPTATWADAYFRLKKTLSDARRAPVLVPIAGLAALVITSLIIT